MNSETKVNGTTVSVDKWEISEDGKKLTRTTWAPGHEDTTRSFGKACAQPEVVTRMEQSPS